MSTPTQCTLTKDLRNHLNIPPTVRRVSPIPDEDLRREQPKRYSEERVHKYEDERQESHNSLKGRLLGRETRETRYNRSTDSFPRHLV